MIAALSTPRDDMTAPACSRRSFLSSGVGIAVGASLAPALAAPDRTNLASLTLSEASGLLASRAVSSIELTQACLDRIEKFNPVLNAFITVTGEQALATARERDDERRRGKRVGPLHGIPVAVKDNIDTAGVRTTAASELFKDRIPSEDAEVVRRLKEAGAVVLGKTNLQEFAYGGSSAVSCFGPVHNPWALERVPGGSSGGSAAATAAGLCFGSLGTDTAGSVRMPSSYCGIVGLKATYGRVSNRGSIPLSWTLDHIGPLCRTVRDTALMLEAIAGFDARDPGSVDVPVNRYSRALALRNSKLRIGLPRHPFFDELDPEVAAAVTAAIEVLRPWAEGVRDMELPPLPPVHVVMGVEAYAYHERWLAESPEKYQLDTRNRIIGLSQLVSKQEYANARRACEVLRRDISRLFADVDVLIMPTVPGPPSLIEPLADNAARDPERTRNTWAFDVTGLPAISVPCGFSRSGLPIGLQIVGAPFAESTVLSIAYAYEQATEWHRRKPALPTSKL
jgi:aspartyl-tRNA(Asn)/glutamyl-tRNA(Gln) amidotransferase subunit A